MDKIKIYNAAESAHIEMPRTRQIETTNELVFSEVTMASGKTKMDIKGFRPGFTAEWEWLPSGLLTQLLPMLRSGGYLKVEYPDATGEDASGYFNIETGGQKIFKFVNGNPMWYGLTLTFKGQGVTKID